MSFRTTWSRFMKHLNRSRDGDFYSCVKWPLLGYRYICLFPIDLERINDDRTHFKWTSPYMIFINIPCLLLLAATSGIYCYNTVHFGVCFPSVILTVNFMSVFVATLFILKLGKHFKKLNQKVLSIERRLPPVRKNSRLVQNIPTLVLVGILASIVQCLLNIMYLYHISTHCLQKKGENSLQVYVEKIFASIIRVVGFSYIVGVVSQIIKMIATVIPTLNNILIIACSVYLENRFNTLNDIIIYEQKKHNRNANMDWIKIQEHYVQLTKLVKIIDRKINPIVFISFSADLFNLCLQWYYVISKKNYYNLVNYSECIAEQSEHLQMRFYKPYTAILMMSKMVTASLLCARLHTASRGPLNCLRTLPQAVYNYDTHRFMEQVYYSNIALSGLGYFYITKEMFLTVLGIFVTYELVLLQFK